MSIGSGQGLSSFLKYPGEKGYNSALKNGNPVKVGDLDPDASYSSDEDFKPWSETESDVSDEEIERAEQADKDDFNPSLYSRFKDKISANFLTIGLAAICFASALYFNGLPSDNQAKECGYNDGASEACSAIMMAVSYVDNYSGQKITELFYEICKPN